MANYDDIFNASAQKGAEDKSFVSFNKEEWAAQKKQERESAFAMIDETAQRMANDGGLFQSYAEFMGESELDTFITGFRLGARFMMDTFLSDDTPLENY